MPSDTKQNRDASQFRRQLIATLVGALIAMCTSAGVSVFQWVTQTRQKEHADRIEAMSQFVGAMASYGSTQARYGYLATKCSYLAARARRLATEIKESNKEVDADYQEFLKENSQFEWETADQYEEIAKTNQAILVAHYKVLLAFGDFPPLQLPLGEQYSVWSSVSEKPDEQQLIDKAKLFDQFAVGFKAAAEGGGKWANKWTADANELARKSGLTK